jgi:hypothetical protein
MGIKRYSDIASMQNPGSQRTGKVGGGSVRAKKAFGDRVTLENITKAADTVAPLAAAHAIGFPAGPIVYESGKAAMGNIMGEPGQKRRKKRKIRRAERRAARRGN